MGSLTVPAPPCGTAACAVQLAHLGAAAASYNRVGMAKGILMHANGIDEDHAFHCLVGASQHQNRKMRLIAEDVITGAAPPASLLNPRARRQAASPA